MMGCCTPNSHERVSTCAKPRGTRFETFTICRKPTSMRSGFLPMLALLLATLLMVIQPVVAQVGGEQPQLPKRNLAGFPLSFTENVGQFDPTVLYQADADGAALWITTDGIYHQLFRKSDSTLIDPETEQYEYEYEQVLIKESFQGANPSPTVVGEDMTSFKSNYFIGNDPLAWRTDVDNYSTVRMLEIYDGIDLRLYGNNTLLESDFIISPGVDPATLEVAFENIQDLKINVDGDLEIETPFGTIIEKKPIAYQVGGSKRAEVECEYQLTSSTTFGFSLPDGYDTTQTLVIDPVLVYSTYLGGSNVDEGFGIDIDDSGYAYVTGQTASMNFPTVNPYQVSIAGIDAFVTKLDTSGSSLIYSTFLGGSTVASTDEGYNIAVDATGHAYVAGRTRATDFPTANAFQPTRSGTAYDAFVTKLSPAGNSLIYSTYLGGSSEEHYTGIAIDNNGFAYLSGQTGSTDFPTQNPVQPFNAGGIDLYLAKLDSSGSALVYSTYLGGTGSDSKSIPNSVAVDALGQAYVVGSSQSIDYPTVGAAQPANAGGRDGVLTKFAANGASHIYSTYLGGSGTDNLMAVAVDDDQHPHVQGYANSSNFPTTNPIQGGLAGAYDFTVTKFDSSGSTHLFSTYLGGSDNEIFGGIDLDALDNIFFTGASRSTDFPTFAPVQGTNAGSYDAVVVEIDQAGTQLLFSTYMGGSFTDIGYQLAVDDSSCAFVTGTTASADFPTQNPFQVGSGNDAFVFKVCSANQRPVAQCQDVVVSADANCEANADIDNGSFDPDGDPVTITQTPSGPYPLGVTAVTLIITDNGGLADTCTANVTVVDDTPPVANCPADIVSANDPGQCSAVVNFAVSATDNCPGDTVIATPASSSVFNIGVTPVEVIATDAAGNADTCYFNVTVNDTESPVAQCPADIVVSNDAGECGAVVNFSATVTDNCPGATILCTPASGTLFPVGVTNVTCIATDAAGNADTCTFSVTVNDTEPPVAQCPADIVTDNDPGACDAVVNFSATVSDNCPGATITCTPPSGSVFPVGTTTVTCIAVDAATNADTCTFTVTVNDTENPTIACPADVTVQCPTDVPPPDTSSATASDNCDPNPVITHMGDVSDGQTCPETITRTYRATDSSGNWAECAQTIVVNDTIAPVFDQPCPGNITVECDAVPPATTLTATDNCDADPTIVFVEDTTLGSCTGEYTLTRTWTVTDDCNNQAQCVQVVTVEDTTPPEFDQLCPADITVECDNIPTAPTLTATDNCDPAPTVTFNETTTPGNCDQEFVITRTWSTTDDCGNDTTCIQVITVEDTTPPAFDQPCPTDITVECDNVPDAAVLTATDNCDPAPVVTYTQDSTGGACPQEYTLTRTWTATDDCDNATVCVQVVTVEDTTPPVCTVPNDTAFFQCIPTEVCLPVNCSDNCNPSITPAVLAGPGQIIGGDWCYTPTVDETATIVIGCDDECGNTCIDSFTVEFDINEPPQCTNPGNQIFTLCDPIEVCVPFTSSDPDNNLDSCYVTTGPGAVVGSQWCYTPGGDEIHDVTIRCVDACGEFCEFTFNVQFELNDPPEIVCPNDTSIHWGSVLQVTAQASDPNPGQPYTVSLGAGSPGDATINPNTGAITWSTDGSDVCDHTFTVVVTDSCGAADTCSFDVCVFNIPPEITCPTDTALILWGDTVAGTVTGNDPDTGPSPLLYSLASFNGPGAPTVDPATGDWEWVTMDDAAYVGFFELQIAVSDGANICDPCSPNNADSCSVFIRVEPTYRLTIEKTHNTIQGQYEYVSITLEDYPIEMGGFDFLIAYDASALTFAEASPGQLLEDCGWEYFTYRYGVEGNCGDACPSGLLRIIAMAETNNGPNHPSCYGPPDTDPHELVSLRFLVTNDRNFECQYVPIRFFWDDCADNTISSVGGDTLFLDLLIYDFENGLLWDEDDDGQFPELTRPLGLGAPDDCIDPQPDKPSPQRRVEFKFGGIDIICADSIDARGDMNLNGISNEISDAVLYANYFVYGLGVFKVSSEGQIAASDVNADGLTLTVADLVYLIRIVVGDALPYPKPVVPELAEFHVVDGKLTVDSDSPMGAALAIITGNIAPTLLADGMDMLYAYDDNNDVTRVLVYSLQQGHSFTGDLIDIPNGDVISLEMATYQGHPVVGKLIPDDYFLDQNYPNPFNPTTTISFGLPVAGDYSLAVYNVAGREVARFNGHAEPGMVRIEWDAANLASGVYFYRLTTGSFSDTKKMILLK